jgi:hypothetical protein
VSLYLSTEREFRYPENPTDAGHSALAPRGDYRDSSLVTTTHSKTLSILTLCGLIATVPSCARVDRRSVDPNQTAARLAEPESATDSRPATAEARQSDVTGASEFAVENVERLVIAEGVELATWVWRGDVLLAGIGKPDVWELRAFRIEDEKLTLLPEPRFANAHFPVFIDGNRIAYVEKNRHIVIATLDGVEIARSPAIENVLHIGDLRLAAGSLWFYSVDAHVEDATVIMYRMDFRDDEESGEWKGNGPLPHGRGSDSGGRGSELNGRGSADDVRRRRRTLQSLTKVGEGYYPRTCDGRTIFFTERGGESRLMRIELRVGEEPGLPRAVVVDEVYMPHVICDKHLVVVQRGFECRSIALYNLAGDFMRTLSGEYRTGSYPSISPSGRLVAFVHHEPGDRRALVVEVVDLEGNLVYQGFVGDESVTSAFRWSADADEIAVTVRDGYGKTQLEFVRFVQR